MRIELQSLELRNFKGATHLRVNFTRRTNIRAKNGGFKSTLNDAFTWLLFGKNAADETVFNVKTHDCNGNTIPRLEHEVMGILKIDQRQIELRKVLKEDWVKPRGQVDEVLKGNTTSYYIDGVEKQQKEYQAFVESIISADRFKLLTNPFYFNRLEWKKRRDMLLQIAVIPTDRELAEQNGLTGLLDELEQERKSAEEKRLQLASKRSKINEELKQIPARLDENQRQTPVKPDATRTMISQWLEQAKSEIIRLDEQLKDSSLSIQPQIDKRTKALKDQAQIKEQMESMRVNARAIDQQQVVKAQERPQAIKNRLWLINSKHVQLLDNIRSLEQSIDLNNRQIESEKSMVDDLRAKWNEINEKLFMPEDNSCPSCGADIQHQKRPVAPSVEAQRDKFNEWKNNESQRIFDMANQQKELIATGEKTNVIYQQNIDAFKVELNTLQQEKEQLEKELAQLQSDTTERVSAEQMLESAREYMQLKEAFVSIVIPEVIPPDTSEIEAKKREVLSFISQYEKALQTYEQIDKLQARREEIMERNRVLSQELADCQQKEDQLYRFEKLRMQAVEDSVNRLFVLCKFRMYERNYSGSEEPACTCLVDGVPFGDANTAGQYNAGLEIIRVFSAALDSYAPIWIDNRERVTEILNCDTQMINLYVDPAYETLTVIEEQKTATTLF